jgi:siroheme synthase-like protein
VKTYPIFLVNLEGRRAVVLGGGSEGERKARELLAAGAAVTVVAAAVTDGLRALAEAERIAWVRRDWRAGDLAGALLAVSAVADRSGNAAIAAEARRERVLLNAMDDPARCDFIAGSVVRRGPLAIAISTGGAAPALAVRLRERLERELGPEYATLVELFERLREPLAERYPDFAARRRAWYDLVDSDLIEALHAPQASDASG